MTSVLLHRTFRRIETRRDCEERRRLLGCTSLSRSPSHEVGGEDGTCIPFPLRQWRQGQPLLSPSLAPPVAERGTFFHALSFSISSVLALDSLTMHTPCRNDYPRSPPLETRTESQTETERCRRCIFAFTLLILSPDVSPTLPPRFSLSLSLSVARRPSGLPERISVSVSITPLASAAAGSHGISGDHHMRHRPVSSLLPVFPHIHEDSFPNSSCHPSLAFTRSLGAT